MKTKPTIVSVPAVEPIATVRFVDDINLRTGRLQAIGGMLEALGHICDQEDVESMYQADLWAGMAVIGEYVGEECVAIHTQVERLYERARNENGGKP